MLASYFGIMREMEARTEHLSVLFKHRVLI